ncbi:MAG: YgiT-type zinc finger protein [Pseudomonadota bacterium]
MIKCHVCGAKMTRMVTNLPFKVSDRTIVILKELPVVQCEDCGGYLLEDPVMQRIDEILNRVNTAAELEVILYAA